jgi:hypothetical protein
MPSSGIELRCRAARISGSPVGRNKRQDQWVSLEYLLLLSRGSRVLCPARFSNYCVLYSTRRPHQQVPVPLGGIGTCSSD